MPGPLTFNEMMLIWQSVTDRSYNKPLLEKQNSLIEVVEQMAEQFARASVSVDRNTQAMFILPWSGQTDAPAAGASKATVTITVTRSTLFDVPIFFTAGDVVIEHRVDDYGPDGAQEVTSGRRFVLTTGAALGPGEAGPLSLSFEAQNEGPGYNEPTPGTLKLIVQAGSSFQNSGASVELGSGRSHRLVCTIFPDVPVPDHVGQYVKFTSGANINQIRRIVGVERPDPGIPHGGVFALAAEAIFDVDTVVGTFAVGEEIVQSNTGARGEFVVLANNKLVLVRLSGTFNGTDSLTGELGATANVNAKEQSEDLVAETGSASWSIMSWVGDLGVTVTNVESPMGGLCGFLDELGAERNIPRNSGETDDTYRSRVAVPADVVSPAAVERAGNRVVEPLGETVCLREVGRDLLPGIFYDGGPNDAPFAYDLDFVELAVADSSGFRPGEHIRAPNTDGIITRGVAQFGYASATSPPGSQPSPTRSFQGATRVSGPGFAAGQTLTGEVSGHVTTITTAGSGILPQHRFVTYLSLREFRGFFLVGVPRLRLEDFGFFYDDTSLGNNPYDATLVNNFYDGAAVGTNSIYSQVYNAVDKVRAGGVPFDLYIEDFGCV